MMFHTELIADASHDEIDLIAQRFRMRVEAGMAGKITAPASAHRVKLRSWITLSGVSRGTRIKRRLSLR